MTLSVTKPSVALLVAATATGSLALNIFVPSMPGLQAALATVPARVQLTLSVFLVGVAVGQLVYGPLSDRFGRRPVLLSGLLLYVGGSLVCALAPSIETLIAGRLVQAVGGCAGMVLARAMVRDAWDIGEATGVLALVITGMAVAPMVAPAIGGYLDLWFGWRASFVFLVLFGGLVWLAGLWRLPETHHTPTPIPGPLALVRAYRSLAVNPVFAGHALVVGLTTAAFFIFLAGAPYTMVERLHRPASEYGLFFIVLSAGYMLGNFAVSRLSRRVSGEVLVLAGVSACLAGPLLLAAVVWAGAVSPWTLFAPMLVMCFGNGLTNPPAMTAAVAVNPRLAGTASGLLGFVQMGMGALAATIMGVLPAGDPRVMVAGMMLVNLLAVAAFAMARRGRM